MGCSLRAELPAWEPRVPESIGPTPAFTLLWNNKTFWEHGNLIYCADGNNNSIFVYLLPPYLPSSQDTSMTLALRVCVCADNTGPPVCVCVRVDNTGPAWSGGRRLQGHGPGRTGELLCPRNGWWWFLALGCPSAPPRPPHVYFRPHMCHWEWPPWQEAS